MCTVLLPPVVNPIAVNKYINPIVAIIIITVIKIQYSAFTVVMECLNKLKNIFL